MSEPPPPTRAELIYVIGMVACTVTFIVALAGWDWAGSKREDLAQWIMAGAAVATLIAAVGAAVFAASAYSLESERESRFQEGQRRQQAERIAAWHQDVVVEVSNDPRRRWTTALPQPAIFLRNASDLPVTAVSAMVMIGGRTMAKVEREVLPPADQPLEVVLAREQVIMIEGAWQELGTTAELHPPRVDLAFTDSAGQRWLREHGGRLTPAAS